MYYPATVVAGENLAAQEFYFASDDGETFYEVTRLPESGEELPSRVRRLKDGRLFKPMGFARRYFTPAYHAPGVRIEFNNEEAAPVGTASNH